MADKITYVNKESLVTDPTIAEKNKVTDNNMNEIKSAVNNNADQLDETIVIGDENITNNSRAVINESEYIPYINSEIDNEYGIATNRGYSQEYINKVTDYSTTEQQIGYWIDGKPLYRKVFNITNPASTNTNYVDISSINIDTAIHLYGYYKTNAGTFGIPFHDSNDNFSVMFISGDNNLYIRGRFGNNYTSITEVKVVLEYTKTTD